MGKLDLITAGFTTQDSLLSIGEAVQLLSFQILSLLI